MTSARALAGSSLVVLLSACSDPLPPSQPPRDASRLDALDIPSLPDVPAADDQPAADGATADLGLDGGMDAAPVDGPDPDGFVTPDITVDRPADARADVPAGPPVCAFTPEQMAVFAVRLALCTLQSPQAALNAFFRPDTWEGGSVQERPCPSLQCLITARGTCASALNECLKYTASRPAGGCPTPAASCEGSPPRTAITCADGVQLRDDCNARQRRCAASATEAACIPMMGDACPAGSPPRCRGSVFESCVLGTYTPQRDCAVSGAVCDPAAAGGCRGDGDACTGDGVSCDGTQLRICRGGRTQRIDCGRVVTGGSCQTVAGRSFCGTASECDPTTAPAFGTCDGATLVTCAGGRIFRFVCTDRGFTTCGPRGCE
jgi:hypothetical protein